MADEEVNNSKHGKLLALNCCHVFKIPIQDFIKIELNKSSEKLKVIEERDFAMMLKNGNLSHLIENSIVHINFVPAVFETEDDIEFITRKKQVVRVDTKTATASLSILTLPFLVPAGIRAAVDVFGDDPILMEAQLRAQLLDLKTKIDQENTAGDLFITVTVPPGLTELFDNLAEKISLEKYRLLRGELNRRVIKMYVYEKSIISAH